MALPDGSAMVLLVGSKFCKQVWQRFGVLSVLVAGGSPAWRLGGFHRRRSRQPGAPCRRRSGGGPAPPRGARTGRRPRRARLPVHEPDPRQRRRHHRRTGRCRGPDGRCHGFGGLAPGGHGGRLRARGPCGRPGSRGSPVLGVVHAGRPGVASGVVPAAVARMRALGADQSAPGSGPPSAGSATRCRPGCGRTSPRLSPRPGARLPA